MPSVELGPWNVCSRFQALQYFLSSLGFMAARLSRLSASNRPLARWPHFTTTTRILQGFAFLCKLGLFLFNPRWDYQI